MAGTFSKGMRQKLAIARALLHDPAVVFLDEPTAALDPEAAFVVREAIEQLRRAGRTIVLATHNLDEADRLCDRIAFVRGGLLRVDSPARPARRPRQPRLVIRLRARRPRSSDAARDAARRVPGVVDADAGGRRPATSTRRARGGRAGGRPRARRGRRRHRRGPTVERTSLEDIYFEVMGVRPGAGGEAT